MTLHGHNKSAELSNRVNFFELLKLLCNRDTILAIVVLENAIKNYSMMILEYQKDIIQTYANLDREMLEKER